MASTGAARWGWGLVLLVSGLILLDGISWLFSGPGVERAYMRDGLGINLDQFTETYPELVNHMAIQMRQLAIWITASGLLTFVLALEGLRHGSRWAWRLSWVTFAAPIAVAANATIGTGFSQLGYENTALPAASVLVFVGLLLAARTPAGTPTRPSSQPAR